MLTKTKTLAFLQRNWILALIVLLAFALRYKGMTYQSLWVDELGAMNEANPANSWKELFNSLRCCDIQPPLFLSLSASAFVFSDFRKL